MNVFERRMPRVAVIGLGRWGTNLARNFAKLGTLAALVDPYVDLTEVLPAVNCETCLSFDQALADPSIDGVAIVTPAPTHFALARQALRAGKHVFVEKPLALTLDDGQTLVDLASRSDLRLMAGHIMRYHPAFLKLEEVVRSGRLGRIQHLHSHRLGFGVIRREEDVLWSFAPHDLSMILSLVDGEPERISLARAAHLQDGVADICSLHLSFPTGEQADILLSWLHPFKEHRLAVVGDAAMAVFDDAEDWGRKLCLYQHRVAWRDGKPVAEPAEGEHIATESYEPLEAECRHFIDCIRTGTTPRTDGREGIRILKVIARAAAQA
jgi:UDP-2-acetamido-3-amino-2,3-dideoxy-glucuronate N-acetyltransferase